MALSEHMYFTATRIIFDADMQRFADARISGTHIDWKHQHTDRSEAAPPLPVGGAWSREDGRDATIDEAKSADPDK